jgi:hypothetical protein
MLSLRRGTVTVVSERNAGLVRLEVDGRPAIAYPRLTGPVALGDDVVVNTQALDLGLGSGGFDILHTNLTRGLGLAPPPGAHVMKLPYTPIQSAWAHQEEASALPSSLSGLPVVCCLLHSQLAAVCAGIGQGRRVVYLQLPGGALPVSLSDAVRFLRRRGYLALSIAVGPCFDADLACVSLASGLAVAASEGAELVVCAIGPGIVGTGSALGHGAASAADAVNAAAALGGRPVLVPRVSEADGRVRHQGLSHHAVAALRLCLARPAVAWPEGLAVPDELPDACVVDVSGWQDATSSLPLESMGRGPGDDPWYFATAFAAGRLAGGLLA